MSEELPIDRLTDEVVNSRSFVNRRDPAFARFEGRVVSFVLKHYGLAAHGPVMVRTQQERTGNARLTFRTFMESFRTFPVWLVPRPVPYAYTISVLDLVVQKRREQSKLFSAFRRLEDLVPDHWLEAKQPYGVVFEWVKSGVPGAYWIIHNDGSARDAVVSVNADDGERIGVQPFASFLSRLGWTP